MPEWHLRKHLSPPPLLPQCRDTWGDTLVGRTPFTSRHRKRRTLPGVTKMVEFRASKAPRKGRADTQHRTQETRLYLSHRGKGATCMLFFFFMQKSNQENRSEFQPTQKHRRKHQRACKVSPVFELFKERLLPPRGGTISCTTGPIRRGRVLLASGEPGDGVSASEPLTHTVFSIPVELVCRVALALVAAHRVHTDLLAASIVDTALVGVCGTKHAPVTAAHY